MQSSLPKYIQPKRLCEERTILTGEFPISRFERLKDLLADEEGKVVIHLTFDQNAQHLCYITGNLIIHWHLLCQRCSGKIDQTIELPVSLSPISSEDIAKRLPERYEPLIVEEDKILLLTMIEDELLLGIPAVPRHDTEDCIKVLQKFNKNSDNSNP